MKKLLCVLCLLLALVCVLVACDTDDGKNGDQSDPCANGHTAGEWVETAPATCTAAGTRQRSCTVCGAVVNTETVGVALGHAAGEWTDIAATCVQGAGRQRACTRCGEVVESEITGDPLGHNAEWVVTVPATTESAGVRSRVCARCSLTLQTAEIGKLDSSGREQDDLGKHNLNYNGEEIYLLYWKEVERPEFEQKELANNNVLDGIYNRNLNVENRLGVDLVFIPMYAAYGYGVAEEFLRKIDAVRTAQTHDYDIIATYARTEASLAVRGHLQNFAKIDKSYMNLNKPWYPKSLVDTVTFGNGSYYFVSGDMSTNVLWMMHCIFVNRDMVSSLHLEDPYVLVRNGSWTIDKMIAMTENLWMDIDNNNKPSVGDQIGFCALNYVLTSVYDGSNMRYIEKDDGMMLKISPDYTSAKAVKLINKLGDWASSNAIWVTNGNSAPDMQANTRRIFQKGKTLLWLEHALYAEAELALGKVSFDYGMIPTPKYDTEQKNYYTGMGNPWTLYGIFVDFDQRGDKQETLSMFTAVLECYASEAYRLTTPEIYEVLLSQKYGEDKDATDMFELIRSGVTFDIGKIFSTVLSNNLPEEASNSIVDNTSWPSKYATFMTKAEESLAKIVADFRAAQVAGN